MSTFKLIIFLVLANSLAMQVAHAQTEIRISDKDYFTRGSVVIRTTPDLKMRNLDNIKFVWCDFRQQCEVIGNPDGYTREYLQARSNQLQDNARVGKVVYSGMGLYGAAVVATHALDAFAIGMTTSGIGMVVAAAGGGFLLLREVKRQKQVANLVTVEVLTGDSFSIDFPIARYRDMLIEALTKN